ncbi:hypothetical protein [Sulfurimonas sp.]
MAKRDNKIKKTIRLTPQTLNQIEGYINATGESFSVGVEELVIKGLENLETAKELKKIVVNELKLTRKENRNNTELILNSIIKLVKFLAKIYSHTYNIIQKKFHDNEFEIQKNEESFKKIFLEEMKV